MSPDSPDQSEKLFTSTRRSLIEKLADWEDQRTWEEFYQTYWRLIFAVSRKAGLPEDVAFDVVQETVLTVAKQWREGQKYDPEKGSFKNWLLNITRWRIADQFRKIQRNPAAFAQVGNADDPDSVKTGLVERIEDEASSRVFEQIWEAEWISNLSEAAIKKVKKKVAPLQFQIFDAYVIKGWSIEKVKKELGVSASQVYLAKHRIGAQVREEAARLRDEGF